MIALNSPIKPNLVKLQQYLQQINDSGWYTNFGPLHQELTAQLQDYLGVKHLLLVNNGTSALQVAARALATKSILSTPFSFIATVSAFTWQNTPVAFSDIDQQSYNLSVDAVRCAFEKGCIADTIVATHVYGNPCDVAAFDKINAERGTKVIYDAAHAFGIKLAGNSVLNYGDASILSFHATKVFHTVEGGAIIFKDKDKYEQAKNMVNFGLDGKQSATGLGLNAKLNEYQAAVGLVNLAEMDNILAHRAELFNAYRTGLNDVVEMPLWHVKANENGAYMPIKLTDAKQLKIVSQSLTEHDIQSRHYFSPSLDQIYTDSISYGTTNSQKLASAILCLPLHAHMTMQDVAKVIAVVKGALTT